MDPIKQLVEQIITRFQVTRDGVGNVQAGVPLGLHLLPERLEINLPTIIDALVDLTFLTKSVRFDDALLPALAPDKPKDDLDSYLSSLAKVIGGQPVAKIDIPLPGPSLPGAIPPISPAVPLIGSTPVVPSPELTPSAHTATDALSGIPGLLGKVVGHIPMLISAPLGVSVKWTVLDENGNEVSSGYTIDDPSSPNPKITFLPVFAEWKDLMPADTAKYTIRATVTLTAGSVKVTRTLDIPVVVPQILVPTIAMLFQQVGYGGATLIFIPQNSPLDPQGKYFVQGVVQTIDTLKQTLGPLAQAQPAFAFFVNSVGNFFLKSDYLAIVKADQITNLHNVQFRGYDFFKDFFNFDGPRAEHIFESLILIGVTDKQLECWNHQDMDPANGKVTFSTGPEMIVKVVDLGDPAPARGKVQESVTTYPPNRAIVNSPPAGQRPVLYDIVSFSDNFSALRFS